MSVKRGDLFWVDLDPTRGSEQAGRRPVLVIQNNIGNDKSATTIVAPITTHSFVREFPTNIFLTKGAGGLKTDSTALLSQIRTIDKTRLEKHIGSLHRDDMARVDQAIKVSLALA